MVVDHEWLARSICQELSVCQPIGPLTRAFCQAPVIIPNQESGCRDKLACR